MKKVIEDYENELDGKEIIIFHISNSEEIFNDFESFKIKNIKFKNIVVNPDIHLFPIDQHLNTKGHNYVAEKLISLLIK